MDIKFFCFYFAEGLSSSDWRQMDFGYRRLSRIGDLLGKEAIDKVEEEVFEELSKRYGPREWEVFLHGDEAETRAVQDEVHRHMSREGCNSRCTQNDGGEVCQLDWSWIEQETQKHRQGLCSLGEYEIAEEIWLLDMDKGGNNDDNQSRNDGK